MLPLEDFPEKTELEDRQFVTALARGLSVMRAFQPGDGILGNGDIAERTGLPKPTVSRLTHTLTRLGYLVHAERLGKYRLGPGVLSLGYSLLANMDIRKIARPYMQELANASGLGIALGAGTETPPSPSWSVVAGASLCVGVRPPGARLSPRHGCSPLQPDPHTAAASSVLRTQGMRRLDNHGRVA